MDKLKEMQAFILAVERGSLARAADAVGVSPAMLGRRLEALEQRLGVRLLHRSTRQQTLTEEGQLFLERCKRVFAEIDMAEELMSASRQSAIGHLRVTAPAGFGMRHVAAHAAAFMARNPRLQVSFNLTDRVVDVVREGYDLGIRIGVVADADLVSIRLAANRRVVCAAPDYLTRHGHPHKLADLENHNCLVFTPRGGQAAGWHFQKDGKAVIVRVRGNPDCNNGEMLHRWACDGLGLAWRSTWEIRRELAEGKLLTVLDEFALPDYDVRAVYPQQRHIPAKVRFFIDYLKEVYGQAGYWER